MIVTALAIHGWFMVLNARGVFDSGFWEIMPLTQWFPGLPGTVDRGFSQEIMTRYTSFFLVFLCSIQWASNPRRLKILLYSVGISACLLAVLGIIQRAALAPSIYWANREIGSYFFATFRYHANAGAFFNLVWPVIAAAFLLSWHNWNLSTRNRLILQFWSLALLAGTIAMLIHGSRAATAISILLVLVWLWIHRLRMKSLFSISKMTAISVILVIGLSLAALSISILGHTSGRWAAIWDNSQSVEMRLNAYKTSLPMLPDAGVMGFGPGSFKWMFPFYGGGIEEGIPGFWRYLHQDYLQTVIEWGWLGASLWFTLIIATISRAIWLLSKPRKQLSENARLLLRGMLLGIIAVGLHGIVDFPFQIFSIQILIFIYLGCIWGIQLNTRHNST
ncbi:MAG: O-antigen ligase family protein [Verrucomicrobiota bacterium]